MGLGAQTILIHVFLSNAVESTSIIYNNLKFNAHEFSRQNSHLELSKSTSNDYFGNNQKNT